MKIRQQHIVFLPEADDKLIMALKKNKDLGRLEPFEFTVKGQPQSKANSRRVVRFGSLSRLIKSDAALSYERAFSYQCPTLSPMFLGDVHFEAEIFYASRRPDLDESLILDGLQGKVLVNDRQVKRKTVQWNLDKENPRAVIRISPL